MRPEIFDEFYDDLENQWRKTQSRFTDKELLAIFPEARDVIPEKIKEYEEEKKTLIDAIKKKLTLIKSYKSDEFSKWFWREWIKINEGTELLKVERHITRLKVLLSVTLGKSQKGRITEEKIQQALEVPIESLISQPLRKSGKTLIGLCPFHQDKHPSFYIYQETNSFYCFGCNKGGNAITFVKLLHGYSFKEAVKYLTSDFSA